MLSELARTVPTKISVYGPVMCFFHGKHVYNSDKFSFCRLCDEQLSNQSHYDFGLRALKSVLVSSGNVKRDRIQRLKEQLLEKGEKADEAAISEGLNEQEVRFLILQILLIPQLAIFKALLFL